MRERLLEDGFEFAKGTVVAWLGVVPYLTAEAFAGTVGVLGAMARGSEVVFDYSYPREVLPLRDQLMLDSLSARVAQAGEPFRLFFTGEALGLELQRAGLRMVENLGSEAMNARYFDRRTDGLRLYGSAGHLCHAEVVQEWGEN